MSTTITAVTIIALIGFALYRQTRTSQLTRGGRYRMALIYGIVGVCLGINVGHDARTLGLIAVSLLASAGVGVLRAQRTRLWRDSDGRIFTRGTRTTIALFLGLIVIKFGIGTAAYFAHIPYQTSIGEVMVMIAIMLAVQATLVWRRVERLGWTDKQAPSPAVSR